MIALASVVGVLAPTAASGDITEPRPRSGPWDMTPLFGTIEGGGFQVTDDREYVRRVRANPDGENPACGNKLVKVKGKHKIRKISRGGYGAWMVGRRVNDNTESRPKSVELEQDGDEFSGKLELGWNYDDRRHGDGLIKYNHGDCQLTFYIEHE